MKKRFLAICLSMMLLVGCGQSMQSYDTAIAENASSSETAEVYDDIVVEDAAEEAGIAAGSEITQLPQTGRKLIRTFDLNIQTKEFDNVVSGIQEKVTEIGGYVEQSSMDSGTSYYGSHNRYSYLTVRVPSDQLDGFIKNVQEAANVTYISENTDDITLKYVDTESRKLALETERDRLMELLEKAETVEEIIAVESRLSEVRYELEAYETTLRTYDNQIDYSTVNISIDEVERETKAEPKTFWGEVAEQFGNSIHRLVRGLRNFAIWILGSSPYLLLGAVLIGSAVTVVWKIKKKKANRDHD